MGRVRALRPDRLIDLPSGLWAVDAVQPVAAVLDPATGAVRAVVGWPQVPPAPVREDGTGSRALGDGRCLWIQQEAGGPVVRVDVDGITTAAWSDGQQLAACGPGTAWCAPRPPPQELVGPGGGRPLGWPGWDRLLHVDATGASRPVVVEGRVRSVQAGAAGLLVQVDDDPFELHHLGLDTYEVVRATRWLHLPWDCAVPERLTHDEHGLAAPPGPLPQHDDGGRRFVSWIDPVDDEPLLALGLHWQLGWPVEPSADRWRGSRRSVALADDSAGAAVRRWDLGVGRVRATATSGGRLVVAVERPPTPPWARAAPVELLALDPARDGHETLLAPDAVDVTQHCWPLVPEPLEAASYAEQVRDTNDGTSPGRTQLVGDWPETHLEWVIGHEQRPGALLRRRAPLFDELGRITLPRYADVHLEEDLATGDLPPLSSAQDGVLDV